MRGMIRASTLALLVVAASAVAFDPPQVVEVPRPAPAKWQEFRTESGRIDLSLKDGQAATWALAEEGGTAELNPPTPATVASFSATRSGRYKIIAFVAGQQPARIVVVVGDGVPGPVDPGPGPVDPPPPGPETYFFVIVRADGPADPVFTKVMGYPEWAKLTEAGHKYKDYTLRDAVRLNLMPRANELPCVITLRISADGKRSSIARGPVPFPITGTAVLELPKGVSP